MNIAVYGSKLTRSQTDFDKMNLVNKLLNYDPWKFMQEKNHQKIYEGNVFYNGSSLLISIKCSTVS